MLSLLAASSFKIVTMKLNDHVAIMLWAAMIYLSNVPKAYKPSPFWVYMYYILYAIYSMLNGYFWCVQARGAGCFMCSQCDNSIATTFNCLNDVASQNKYVLRSRHVKVRSLSLYIGVANALASQWGSIHREKKA